MFSLQKIFSQRNQVISLFKVVPTSLLCFCKFLFRINIKNGYSRHGVGHCKGSYSRKVQNIKNVDNNKKNCYHISVLSKFEQVTTKSTLSILYCFRDTVTCLHQILSFAYIKMTVEVRRYAVQWQRSV